MCPRLSQSLNAKTAQREWRLRKGKSVVVGQSRGHARNGGTGTGVSFLRTRTGTEHMRFACVNMHRVCLQHGHGLHRRRPHVAFDVGSLGSLEVGVPTAWA